ncbi:MAG: hypothetical protein WC624_01275, partial [Candidatus Margulisiibacteriota bacterium]
MDKLAVSRRSLLLGGASLLLGCQVKREVKAPEPAPVTRIFYDRSATVTIVSAPIYATSEYLVFHYAAIEEAVKPAIDQGAMVISWGELHKEASDQPSTLESFVSHILPTLHDSHYDDGIIETLPSGMAALRELNEYKRTGVLGPVCSKWIGRHPNRKAIGGLLQMAKNNQANIYGSNCADFDEYYKKYREDNEKLGEVINENTRRLILKLIADGKKRIWAYGGAYHNDFTIKEGITIANFGADLHARLGRDFM